MNLGLILQATAAKLDSVTTAKIQENADKFTQIDPWGIGMTFVGMTVVFISLLLLYMLFFNITKLLNVKIKKSKKVEGKEPQEKENEQELSGNVGAAIAMALHLYMSELHDKENTVLTINKVARTYSPWSSKIYGLRQNPR
ncbi:MAG: OadG family protein [Ignavibacteriales bacterium]|jgi:glutaconyl-CoA/methylmalonyl-CoA decarboxylase subunit delta|nr:OadG family protein [Ignavibacteriales bacterium]MBK7978615.1 OadG family protein [Ignavibacteriota bacterium]